MVTIHKYQFQLAHEFEIEMPDNARILSVQEVQGEWCMWALVENDVPVEKRKFKGYWTGEELNGLAWFRTHIATVQDVYVWHIFE